MYEMLEQAARANTVFPLKVLHKQLTHSQIE